MAGDDILVVNGWRVLVHPQFAIQLTALATEVAEKRKTHPTDYRNKNCAKRLAAIVKLAFETIPADPANPIYRLGNTLGPTHRHWFRAKFFQQYRLFFRYDQKNKVLVYAWVNDDKTKRAYGHKTDAYAVFLDMLARENPPTDWDMLIAESNQDSAVARMKSGLAGPVRT